jgi:hypothetical protein
MGSLVIGIPDPSHLIDEVRARASAQIIMPAAANEGRGHEFHFFEDFAASAAGDRVQESRRLHDEKEWIREGRLRSRRQKIAALVAGEGLEPPTPGL